MLGETLPEIAFEKAGIIKKETPVIIGEYQEEVHQVFYQKALESHASLFLADKNITEHYPSDLKGVYQQKNVKTAVQTIRVLNDLAPKVIGHIISENHIKKGLLQVVKNTGLFGRWQILSDVPKTICDTAHNKEGLQFVLEQLQSQKFDKLHIVLGVVNDKNLEMVLPMFPKNAVYYFCKPNIPRGLDATVLKNQAADYGLIGSVYPSVLEALQFAQEKATSKDLIFVGGSTFVVAEVV